MDAHEVLVKARNLIAHEKDWSPRMWGRGGRRCAVHALQDVILGYETEPDAPQVVIPSPAYSALCGAVGIDAKSDERFGSFNDAHSHAEVVAAFDKAIAATAPKPDVSFLDGIHVVPERAGV